MNINLPPIPKKVQRRIGYEMVHDERRFYVCSCDPLSVFVAYERDKYGHVIEDSMHLIASDDDAARAYYGLPKKGEK